MLFKKNNKNQTNVDEGNDYFLQKIWQGDLYIAYDSQTNRMCQAVTNGNKYIVVADSAERIMEMNKDASLLPTKMTLLSLIELIQNTNWCDGCTYFSDSNKRPIFSANDLMQLKEPMVDIWKPIENGAYNKMDSSQMEALRKPDHKNLILKDGIVNVPLLQNGDSWHYLELAADDGSVASICACSDGDVWNNFRKSMNVNAHWVCSHMPLKDVFKTIKQNNYNGLTYICAGRLFLFTLDELNEMIVDNSSVKNGNNEPILTREDFINFSQQLGYQIILSPEDRIDNSLIKEEIHAKKGDVVIKYFSYTDENYNAQKMFNDDVDKFKRLAERGAFFKEEQCNIAHKRVSLLGYVHPKDRRHKFQTTALIDEATLWVFTDQDNQEAVQKYFRDLEKVKIGNRQNSQIENENIGNNSNLDAGFIERYWDRIENSIYDTIPQNTELTKADHKALIARDGELVLPFVFDEKYGYRQQAAISQSGRNFFVSFDSEKSWLDWCQGQRYTKKWSSKKMSIQTVIDNLKKLQYDGLLFTFKGKTFRLELNDLEEIKNDNDVFRKLNTIPYVNITT